MKGSRCSCVWRWTGGAQVMAVRDPDCDMHGDGSGWWRRVLRRAARKS